MTLDELLARLAERDKAVAWLTRERERLLDLLDGIEKASGQLVEATNKLVLEHTLLKQVAEQLALDNERLLEALEGQQPDAPKRESN